MTASSPTEIRSRARSERPARRAAAAVAAVASALACASPPPAPARLLEPLSRAPAVAPTPADHLAARLAAAALVGRRDDAARLLDALERDAAAAREDARAAKRSKGEGRVIARSGERRALVALASDLAASTLPDERAYRDAARDLLSRGDLDEALRARLEQAVADDPVALARARLRDRYEALWADTFNAVSAPLGRSLLTGYATAPLELSMSAVHWVARWFERPPVGLFERQALRHWDDYLARHPDAAATPEARGWSAWADGVRADLRRMQRDHFAAAAELALEHAQPDLARAQIQRARAIAPGAIAPGADARGADAELDALDARAADAVARRTALRAASLEAPDALDPHSLGNDAALLRAVWVEPAPALGLRLRARLDAAAAARAATASELDAARFALATTQHEQGAESAAWAALDRIASGDPQATTVARHAAALVASPWQNPDRAFHAESARSVRRAVATEIFGRYASGPRYRALPAEVAYLIDAPVIAQTALSTPFRLLLSPLQGGPRPDWRRGAAIAAYRYLERFPDGEHVRERVEWLFEYEEDRENALGALRLADWIPDFDAERRAELAEEAAAQQLDRAVDARRRDTRAQLLRGVVREFPDSEAGKQAGLRARDEREKGTPQRIRMTRGFLAENPRIAGPLGLGIDPMLLDGSLHNGELHDEGVSFLGGRVVELALVAQSGEPKDEPERVRARVGAERLARTVALLEESALLGVELDADDAQTVDGSRDLYLERARLGLTDEVDARPTAESTYVYRGLRERYGLVRGRESILPFDLVLQGSLGELGLGAFPRWRPPEPTPDAFLYR